MADRCTTTTRAAAALSALLLSCVVNPTVGAVRKLQTIETRDFGYVIGDMIERRIHLQLDAPYRLRTEELPEPDVVNLWLRREPITVQHDERDEYNTYELTLRHQIIGVPETISAIFVPELRLTVTDGRQSLDLPIPSWSVSVSPITQRATHDDPRFVRPQPDTRPLAAPLTPTVANLVASGLGLLLAMAYFVYAFATLPWLARTNGPFAHAHKKLRAFATAGSDAESYALALRSLHHAFNQTAGRAVFADGLSDFFLSRPQFRPLQAPIEDFFARSQNTFFTGVHGDQPSIGALLQLCRRCRDVERGLT